MIFSADKDLFNFSYKRLRNLYVNYAAEFEEKYAKAYVTWISPKDYLSLTVPGDVTQFVDKAKPLDYTELCNQQQEMFLKVDFEKGEVVGHEGRHRMAALYKAGVDKVAITIIPRNQEDKYNREFINSFTVKGQSFPIDPPNIAEGVVELRCLAPVNMENKQHVYSVYGPSLPLATFIGRKFYAVEDIYQLSSGDKVSTRKRYMGTVKGLSDVPEYSKGWHPSNPFKISFIHIHNEKNPKGYQDYSIKVSDFLNWIQEGKYVVPSLKGLSLDEAIASAKALKNDNHVGDLKPERNDNAR